MDRRRNIGAVQGGRRVGPRFADGLDRQRGYPPLGFGAPLIAPRSARLTLERFPTGWNHPVDKKSLSFQEEERVLVEKVYQLFRNTL
jgi:hypothetical protein